MAPPARKIASSFCQSRSALNPPRLDGFRTDLAMTPEEHTPRAIRLSHDSAPLSTSSNNINPSNLNLSEQHSSESSESNPLPTTHSPTQDSPSASSSSSSSPPPSPRRLLSRSQSSLLTFAPPFYNRPPTPLPPSPSLTSLLRPSFSTTTSRPTTPDSSENDTPNDTEAAVAKSARTATTVPRASPKVPTYEYYGFVLYLMSSLAFLMYLLWAYLPSPFLHQLGIYYYPNRWWALAIPAFLVMAIVYIYVALAAYNTGNLTLPMSSVENIVDRAANVAVLDGEGRIARKGMGEGKRREGREEWSWAAAWSEGTDAVMDVPVGGVCEILYGDGRSAEAGG
ncbi:hypothetical protein MMC13_003683 [Lambiella insularis]|nr:hypothetical protein [Lambiella insularis]